MFKQIFCLTVLLATVYSQGAIQGGSLDDLISSVFNTTETKIDPIGDPNTNHNPNPNPTPGPNPNNGGDQPRQCPGGECVQYYLCNNNTLNTDGENLIDIRFNEDEPCPNYLESCCALPDKTDKPINIITPDIKEGCGHRNVEGIGFRITESDSESQYGEFPWMVAVLKEEKALEQVLNVYQCGGSLIHPNVILTAAHCVDGKSPSVLKIRAGEWDTQTKNEIWPHQDRQVSAIVMHQDYYKGALFNDIALLFIDHPVDLVENVQTLCLPPQGTKFDHSRCTASGWGKDVFGKQGKYQVILKKIDLPIVPHADCQASLRKTRLGARFNLDKSFVCAGGVPGKDTCKGDGGSPLVCPSQSDPKRFYQTGIVAWGIGCGENGTPGVYANVALFREWIDNQFRLKNLDQKYYTL